MSYKRKFIKLMSKLITVDKSLSVYFNNDEEAKLLDETFISLGETPEIEKATLPDYL